jgi:hypothetical protein
MGRRIRAVGGTNDRHGRRAPRSFLSSYLHAPKAQEGAPPWRTKAKQEDFKGDWHAMICGDYRSEAARACLDTMRSMSCEDWAEKRWTSTCKGVYGC